MIITIDMFLVFIILSLLFGTLLVYNLGQLLVEGLKDNRPLSEAAKNLINLLKQKDKWNSAHNLILTKEKGNFLSLIRIKLNFWGTILHIEDERLPVDSFTSKEWKIIRKYAYKLYRILEVDRKEEEKDLIKRCNILAKKNLNKKVENLLNKIKTISL